jgi:hypothetical protein
MSGSYSWPLSVRFTVAAVETVDVDGASLAYGVSEEVIATGLELGSDLNLLGEFSQAYLDDEPLPLWWSAGVGRVRYWTWDSFLLAGYDLSPTRRVSWGEVKASFRQ